MEQLFFDARELPPSQAFDRWRVGVSDFELIQLDPGRAFDGTSTVTSLGSVLISESDLPPLRFLRTREKVLLDGHDLWSLSLVVTGGIWGDADGNPFRIGPSEIALFSHTRPSDIFTEQSRTITLAIPGTLLRGADPMKVHGALPRNAETRLLATFLRELCQELPTLSAEAALPLSRALLAMIQAALPGRESNAAKQRGVELRQRLFAYIETRLDDDLNADRLCDVLAVSRSALYRAVGKDGGLQAVVRKLRLQEAHRRLGDVSDSRTIQEIARSVGYADSALFSRHFHNAFGYTASVLREKPLIPPAIRADSDDIPRDFRSATDQMFERPGAA